MDNETARDVRLILSFGLIVVTAILIAKFMPPIGAGGLECGSPEVCRQIAQKQREAAVAFIQWSTVGLVGLALAPILWTRVGVSRDS